MSQQTLDPRDFQMEQIAAAAEDYEGDLVRSGSIPDLDRLPLAKVRRPFEWLGGILLGAIVSFLAIWAVHYALNTYLHYGAG